MSELREPSRSRPGSRTDLAGRAELGLWALAWFSSPFYLMPEGRPQLYDVLLAAQFGLMLASGRLVLVRRASPPLAMLAMLVVYTALVGSVWSLVYEAPAFLVPSLYYGFDLAVVVVALALYHHHGTRLLQVTLYGWMLGMVVQLGLVWVMPPGFAGVRSLAFFNDPNQLAIYGVAGGVLAAQLGRRVGVPPVVEYAVLVVAGILVVASVSRAGALAFSALVVVRFASRPRTIVAGLVVGTLVVLALPLESLPVDFIRDRLVESTRSSTTSLLLDRGYGRILEQPHHLLLGAGEGMLSRFETPIEIHSTPGTLLFCYGIPGTVLFFGACVRILLGARRGEGVLLLPLLVLGLFHHTLRVRFFWLNLALVVVSGLERSRERRRLGSGGRGGGR